MTKGIIAICLVLAVLVSCAPQAAPAAKPASADKAAWEVEWDKVLAAAKQEGKVSVQSTGGAEQSRAMMEGFKKAYGLDAEVVVARPASEDPKISAERKAGLYLRDIYLGGYNTALDKWRPDGWMDPLDLAFIQPHLTDPEVIKKVWWEGKLWWVDKEHYILISTLQARPTIAINTNLVKEGEIKSYRDMLNPKWKGKIIQDDPNPAGGGQQVFVTMYYLVGEDFVRALAKMEPTLSRDERQVLDWLAQGKMAIAIAPDGETIPVYEKAGAPIKVIIPAEGVQVSAASSGLIWFNKPAHPNAAKVFINWITTKEGQEPYAIAGANQSLRVDVSTAYLPYWTIRQPGLKYHDAWSEEANTLRPPAVKVAKELYGKK